MGLQEPSETPFEEKDGATREQRSARDTPKPRWIPTDSKSNRNVLSPVTDFRLCGK